MGGVFTRRRYAIVTANAVTRETAMVHHRGQPRGRGMAGITFGRSNDVVGRLTGRNYIVVTAGANTQYFLVVNTQCGRRERCRSRRVAGIANIRGINVRSGFTRRNCIIVTTNAGTNNLGMINRARRHRCPACRIFFMTGITYIRCIDMACILATGVYPVVTSITISAKPGMIHRRRHPLTG